MSKTRQEKSDAIAKLVKEFRTAKSVVFADYQGLTVAKADALRKSMRESKVDYVVAKKSIITKAAKEAGFDLNAKLFPGMIGVAFGLEDEVAPARVFGDMSKDSPIKLVGGVFEGAIVSQEKVIALSKLPSKKQLLGMLVATIAAPMSAFARVINAYNKSKEPATA